MVVVEEHRDIRFLFLQELTHWLVAFEEVDPVGCLFQPLVHRAANRRDV